MLVRPDGAKIKFVAPPRGERGLKCNAACRCAAVHMRRSPSWGAWIEIYRINSTNSGQSTVAPPRGERGLKYHIGVYVGGNMVIVAPPRGERGLKCFVRRVVLALAKVSLPLVGSVD